MMKPNRNVGMILERDFPPDDRPEKEARSLIEHGFNVHMLCYSKRKAFKARETYKGIKITRFYIPHILVKKLSATYLVLPFYRFIWKRQIKRFLKENAISIIHIHDLPMTDIAVKCASEYGCKLVCDQHEYWSNWIVNTAHYNTFLGKIVNRLSDWKSYEKENLQAADLVITVAEPLRKLYIDEVGIDPGKLLTVPNTTDKRYFNADQVNPAVAKKYANDFVLFYAGAIDSLRGVETAIESLPRLKQKIPNIKIVLAGRIAANMPHPLKLAADIGCAEHVEFIGWLQVDQIASYIAASKICFFIPPGVSMEVNNTIATKIYQYMAMGKPIITSEARMMREFVVENKLGLSVASRSAEDFAEAVLKIAGDYESFSAQANNASQKLRAGSNIFWHQTVQPMIDFYESKLAR